MKTQTLGPTLQDTVTMIGMAIDITIGITTEMRTETMTDMATGIRITKSAMTDRQMTREAYTPKVGDEPAHLTMGILAEVVGEIDLVALEEVPF